ncbi:MAG: alkaline phosphatase family protein [Actinobacteria bacterium]|nr:alkaline phosphatase family protein [Actinomycetota bacterium]
MAQKASLLSKVLLLGLDGMTDRVLDPAFEAGHLPRLKALLDRGVRGKLTSTVPPYTPPGWTSIFTGVNPGKHGIFGFTLGNIQREQGLVRLDRVRAPALWNIANAQDKRVGLFNVPMTFPPPPVDGFAVAGMLTPEGGGETPRGFTHPPELAERLVAAAGAYEIDIDVDYDQDWKSTAIIERLSRNLALKRAALRYLLETNGDVPILFAVLEAPDRLMHVHYKYIDPDCPHFDRPEAGPIRERAWAFFDEMDEVIGDLLAWAGDDGWIVTMSDHGFGPKEKVVNVNVALREWGLLSVAGAGTALGSAGARRLARRVKKVIPKAAYRKAKTASRQTIDWSKTKAFASPNPQQGIYVNLRGREPHGIVADSDYESVRDEIIERFSTLRDPDDGAPVLDRMHKREEVLDGPLTPEAPDLFPVCRDYSYELSDGLFSPSVITDYRDLPRGFHHSDGIFGIAGPAVSAAAGQRAHLYDITPTALYLAGCALPEMDGTVLLEFLPEDLVAASPVRVERMDLPLAGEGAEARPYSPEEEAQIEESLRNLGYL